MEAFEEEKVPTRAGLTGELFLLMLLWIRAGRGSPFLWALPERGWGCKGLP